MVPPDRRQTHGDRRDIGRGGGRRITDLQTHPDAHVTVQAFAEYLVVHEHTVMKWIEAGELPAFQFPRRKHGEWRIAVADAVAFVTKNRFRTLAAADSEPESTASAS
jgi:excisionase family DNA binding protein